MFLFLDNVRFFLRNVTKMEDIEHVRYARLTHHQADVFPSYDRGAWENWKAAMGSCVLCWFLPCGRPSTAVCKSFD